MERGGAVHVDGLKQLLEGLKGPLFKDVNRSLRGEAGLIAKDLMPDIQAAMRRSRAPQADKVAATARVHRDRVPVVAFAKVNPKLTGFTHKGENAASRKRRRGAVAHGVVYGPKGGHRNHGGENFYRISRDDSGGPLGDALRAGGKVYQDALAAYLEAYLGILEAHGFLTRGR